MNQNSDFIPDDSPDAQPYIAARSRLFSLEPIGSGTRDVESVTSYLTRLARAHSVSTWSPLKCEIAPILFSPAAHLRNRLSDLVGEVGSAFNGNNGTSKKLITALCSLTGRHDLAQMTMNFCGGFIGPRLLIRIKQAWCGVCLSEWSATSREIFYPLLWQLNAVTACPVHGIPLSTKCPKCHRSFHPVTARSHLGFCSRCGFWLGSLANEGKFAANDSGATTNLETSRRVSDFLHEGREKLKTASAGTFSENLKRLLRDHFSGNAAQLARFLAVHRYSVIAWRNGVHRPTLLLLADLSRKVNVPMANLLSDQLSRSDFALHTGGGHGRRFAGLPNADLKKMRRLLESAAKGEIFPYPSLRNLAEQIGCHQTTLRRRFPALTEQVKSLYKTSETIRLEVRSKLVRSIVNSTVVDLHRSGVYPSESRLRECLPKFIHMREPVANNEWKRALAKLNDQTDSVSMATDKWPPYFGHDKVAKAANK